jgi:hypothetical protein
MKEGEYGKITMYSCMKMEKMGPVETIPKIGRREITRMMAGVNLTKIYCKHFYKCYNVPTIQQ